MNNFPPENPILEIQRLGRRSALDAQRMNPPYKVDVCARRVFRIWSEAQSSQIVFLDSSAPDSVYRKLEIAMTQLGIPIDEIAFLQDSPASDWSAALLEEVNQGIRRIIVISVAHQRAFMSMSAAVQHRLVAVHHLGNVQAPFPQIAKGDR